MVKYSFLALTVIICLAYVMSAPADNEEAIPLDSPADGEVEDVQPSGTKKIKRGIYGGGYGYGLGHYPYLYSFYPYGHYGGFGHGYGYGHYPYYGGYGHGYGHGFGSFW